MQERKGSSFDLDFYEPVRVHPVRALLYLCLGESGAKSSIENRRWPRCGSRRKYESEVFMEARKLVVGFVVSFLIALGCNTVANAYTFKIDNFRIIRNGNLFFEDTFSDGSPPPFAPTFRAEIPPPTLFWERLGRKAAESLQLIV